MAGAQSGLPLIQPDAGLVFGIEWRKLLESPTGSALKEHLNKPELASVKEYQVFKDIFFDKLDSVVIGVPSAGLKNGKQPPPLVVVKGRFDLAPIRTALLGKGANPEKYRTVELLLPPESGSKAAKPDNFRIALLDANTILCGDAAEVRAAIDRVTTGRLLQSHKGTLEGVAELAAANDVWMVFTMPPSTTKDASNPMNQMLADVKGAQLGMSFGNGLAVRMNVRAKDSAAAAQVAKTIQGFIGMAALSGSQNPQSVEMLKKVQVAPEGSQVRIALTVDKSELEKIIQESQSIRTARQPAGRDVVTGTPEPAGRKTIRISGLDGGPVEVPLSSTKK